MRGSAQRARKSQEKQSIEQRLDKVRDISIEHPYLEDDNFCSNWPTSDRSSEKSMRYENYCCLWFNLCESIWEFYGGKKEDIEDFIYVKEIFKRHRKWWQFDTKNSDGYGKNFVHFVNSYIEDDEKKGGGK